MIVYIGYFPLKSVSSLMFATKTMYYQKHCLLSMYLSVSDSHILKCFLPYISKVLF